MNRVELPCNHDRTAAMVKLSHARLKLTDFVKASMDEHGCFKMMPTAHFLSSLEREMIEILDLLFDTN